MLACSAPCCICSGKSVENTTTRNLKFPRKPPSPETPCANVLSLKRYTHRICAKFAQPVCTDLHMEFVQVKCESQKNVVQMGYAVCPFIILKGVHRACGFCTNSSRMAVKTLYWAPCAQTAHVKSCRNFRFRVVVFSSRCSKLFRT